MPPPSLPPAGSSTNASSHHQFTRNASCPTQRTLSSLSSTTGCSLLDRQYSSSSNAIYHPHQSSKGTKFESNFLPTDEGTNRSNTFPHNRLGGITLTSVENLPIQNGNLLQRIKHRVVNLFKHISGGNGTTTNDDPTLINQSQSTFAYDPELDLREEHLSLVAKRLLTTLRECKIKHLSCDNLFIPCNHLRNIARQCLIMSAEEPFGIMGAQIKIKLTLLSSSSDSMTNIKYLSPIVINSKQKTIFEIEIDLHEDTKMFTLRRFLPQMKMFKQLKEKSPLYVSPRCLLVKNVFYKTAEPKRAIVNTFSVSC